MLTKIFNKSYFGGTLAIVTAIATGLSMGDTSSVEGALYATAGKAAILGSLVGGMAVSLHLAIYTMLAVATSMASGQGAEESFVKSLPGGIAKTAATVALSYGVTNLML